MFVEHRDYNQSTGVGTVAAVVVEPVVARTDYQTQVVVQSQLAGLQTHLLDIHFGSRFVGFGSQLVGNTYCSCNQ